MSGNMTDAEIEGVRDAIRLAQETNDGDAQDGPGAVLQELHSMAMCAQDLLSEMERARKGASAAASAYIALLGHPQDAWRASNQHVYVLLRDALAVVLDGDAEIVQQSFEAFVAGDRGVALSTNFPNRKT